jgi:hypothetical protein
MEDENMDGMIPVGDEQERPVRARRRSVWIVARAWRGLVVEVTLRPTRAAADRLADAWLRVYNDENETDVAVFRRVLPKED